jgi:hypothetical protein
MAFLARLNPRYFAAIHQCAAKNDIRYYLNAVQIERHPDGGVLIIATNGHFLGAIHDPEGWLHPDHKSLLVGCLSKRLLSACLARRGSDSCEPAWLWVAEKFSMVSSEVDLAEEPDPFGQWTHLADKTELVDGKFPDWRRVVPSARKAAKTQYPCLNGEYLEAFNKIGTLLSGQKRFAGGGIHLEVSEDPSKVIVRFNDRELMSRFMGLIMAMHGDKVETILPDWAMRAAEQAASAA